MLLKYSFHNSCNGLIYTRFPLEFPVGWMQR